MPIIGKCVKLSSLDSEELNENSFRLIGLTVAPKSLFKNWKKNKTQNRQFSRSGNSGKCDLKYRLIFPLTRDCTTWIKSAALGVFFFFLKIMQTLQTTWPPSSKVQMANHWALRSSTATSCGTVTGRWLWQSQDCQLRGGKLLKFPLSRQVKKSERCQNPIDFQQRAHGHLWEGELNYKTKRIVCFRQQQCGAQWHLHMMKKKHCFFFWVIF